MTSRAASAICCMASPDYGWEPVIEGGNVIALAGSDGTSALNRPASSNSRARRLKTCTRPAPKPDGT
jgi:hypothetical protein